MNISGKPYIELIDASLLFLLCRLIWEHSRC